MGLFGNLFDSEKRHFHQAEVLADKVLKLEETYAQKSDDDLREVTRQLQEKIQAGASLKDVLPDAFANAREAAKRVLNEFPYRVQVLGGVLLHEGDIAEMKTGEGKTLTAVMPIYLHALAGKGAHVVTVNEYLAKRDAEWMGRVYTFLGLTVGCNLHSLSESEKRDAYACDITYTTNSELGFDYLRDNMVMRKEQRVLRGLHYAVLDEVDSILIDEARTPLIISGPGPVLDQQYIQADRFAKSCKRDVDFEIDREDRTVVLTDAGLKKADRAFGIENIYNGEHASIVHYIQNAMRANYLMTRDVEYVVGDDEIILVDQFTGRKMAGREFSDGLHQAIQAKENVGIKQETITLATITYQNFFRLYDLLSGMTGTAKTEEDEFLNTYNMRVYEVPTNRPIARIDEPDLVFKDRHEKYEAIVKHTKELYEKGQPVLIGTLSIGINEALSEMLKKQNIPHHVLNAKNDENEAEIIAKAGQKFAVTVATNMAGRGTDIKLGEGVRELGGLCVIGTERHESRRIDNQLRGRSGRQGDPGESQFYLSLEDELMRRFGSERIKAVLDRMNLSEEESVIKSRMLTRQVEGAQKRVEGNNYDTRKQVLQYDDVMREQREIIYAQRYDVITADRDLAPEIHAMMKRTINRFVDGNSRAEQDEKLESIVNFAKYNLVPEESIEIADLEGLSDEDIKADLYKRALEVYDSQVAKLRDEESVREFQKVLILRVVDSKWTDHIDALDQLRNAVGLRGYAQNNPVVEYQAESFRMFNDMIGSIEFDVTRLMMKAQIHEQERPRTEHHISTTATRNISAQHSGLPSDIDLTKVKRNDLCPCGSGKKFKNCHGRHR